MGTPLATLLIDDSPEDTELLLHHLRRNGYEVTWTRVETPDELRRALAERTWDIALCDYVMPRLSGPEALDILRTAAADLPAITVSGQVGEEYAVQVMRSGARDYVRKDNLVRLVPAIERELNESQQHRLLVKAESALKTTEERFEAIFKQAPLGLALIDSQSGKIYDANPRLATILGRTPSELTAMTWAALLGAGKERDSSSKELSPKGGLTVHEDYVGPGGKRALLQVTISPISVGGARDLYMVEDITERKAAEVALQQSETRYRSILAASPDDITITDVEGKVVMVSPAGVRLSGYERDDQIIGRPLLDFLVPEDRERAAANIALLARGIRTGPAEYRCVRADGSTFVQESNAEFLRDPDGNPTGLVLVIRDLTERKKNEEELRRQHETYATLLQSTTDGVWVLDTQERIIDANPSACAMIGYSRDELLRLSVRELDADMDDATVTRRTEQIVRDGRARFETHHRRKDGRLIAVDVNVTFVPHLGGRMYAFVRDITERQRTDAALRFAQTVVDNMQVAVYWADASGRFVYVNEAACRTLGYERQELLELAVQDVSLGVDDAVWQEQWATSEKYGSLKLETQHRAKDGSLVPVLVEATRIRFDGQEYSCGVAFQLGPPIHAAGAAELVS